MVIMGVDLQVLMEKVFSYVQVIIHMIAYNIGHQPHIQVRNHTIIIIIIVVVIHQVLAVVQSLLIIKSAP